MGKGKRRYELDTDLWSSSWPCLVAFGSFVVINMARGAPVAFGGPRQRSSRPRCTWSATSESDAPQILAREPAPGCRRGIKVLSSTRPGLEQAWTSDENAPLGSPVARLQELRSSARDQVQSWDPGRLVRRAGRPAAERRDAVVPTLLSTPAPSVTDVYRPAGSSLRCSRSPPLPERRTAVLGPAGLQATDLTRSSPRSVWDALAMRWCCAAPMVSWPPTRRPSW
jgi:hypothetical protein